MSTSTSVGVGDLPCFPTFFSMIPNFSLYLYSITVLIIGVLGLIE